MLFYKAEAALFTDGIEPEKSERAERAVAMQPKIEMFCAEREGACHIAVSNILYRKKKALLCVAAKQPMRATDIIEDFMKAVDLEFDRIDMQEVTIEVYCKMLRAGCRCDYIDDDDDVCEKIGIADLRLSFSEKILSGVSSKKSLLGKAETLLCDGSLRAEIERIYQGAAQAHTAGHPVHYLLQSDDREAKDQMLRILLTALYQNGRLQSRRYAEVGFDGNDYLPENALNALYESCAGGAVAVSFAEDACVNTEYAGTGVGVISELCAVMRQHRNKTLTIFCLQRKAKAMKDMFLDRLGAITLVPITQETVFDERAKAYLRSRAKEHGASPDRLLYRPVSAGKAYSAADLNLIFDEWYDRRLKTRVYTQYADLETANKQVALRKPKGSAFDELSRMIGLSEAKSVIKQALDFYKAQKLFREKGFSSERPAMHMVFTGNPGTAKTTAARLFAQIMKDNDLLSVGDLHEVGRADLVGRYVGWTAQIVKERFKAAKGSVLFIDEAYSLAERDGLYGDEAINTIVQEMENMREEIIVIFAGYPDKTEAFLQKNPGLRSRIAFHVPFADYSADELFAITELLADKKQISLAASVRDKLLPIFETAMNRDDFGNGRFARNLFEKAVMKQASRLVAMDADNVSKADVGLLLAEDFEAPAPRTPQKSRIGF
jgi:AAA+ superfamily predicted ATPase